MNIFSATNFEVALKLPDLWQRDAVRALKAGADVVVDAPTGAGKTWVFEMFLKEKKFSATVQAVYTVPTRALANDKWREWKKAGWRVGIATGDLAEDLDAPVVVATLETQRERILRGEGPALLVIDEYQMIADESRGLNYELTIGMAGEETQLLLLSGSVGNPREIVSWLERLGRKAELVQVTERPVPLDEEALEGLPAPPRNLQGFWQHAAARVCLGGLAPLLIFVPQRAGAEKVARQIAAVFPEDDPIDLPENLRTMAGKELTRMLKRRVAFHHSGLSYGVRSCIVEPLAKAGQLRVVVATMGLAAGINFSVRTVFVAENTFSDGRSVKQLRPDELLQMFGRAGRRGIDEIGHVLVTDRSARLLDAAPRKLRRVNEIDWPTLLRVMGKAAASGVDPFEAAAGVCGRLFSAQSIDLGIVSQANQTSSLQLSENGFAPRRREILNSRRKWENASELRREQAALKDCRIVEKDRERNSQRALKCPWYVKSIAAGSPCKIRRPNGGFDYGLEWKVATTTEDGHIDLLKWVKRELSWSDGLLSYSDFRKSIVPRIVALAEQGTELVDLVQRGSLWALQLDLAHIEREAVVDFFQVKLVEPIVREVEVEVDTSYEGVTGTAMHSRPDSAAHAWRTLGLVESDGTPTRRGEVFSFFQGGEGLVIAAALEDVNYPLDDLAWHLANLRCGFRFHESADGESGRLSMVSRQTFGLLDYPGYLSLGVNPEYGEGASEIIFRFLHGEKRLDTLVGDTELSLISRGDIERACVEWLSLLRHIENAPGLRTDPDWERWHGLKRVARELILRFGHQSSNDRDLPQLPGEIFAHKPRLQLRKSDFSR